ncbi:MAG: histidine phosphatase family protein [Candidatus Latescibacterota bacterium]|nr:MAG: histidine phosphatase family protein [Candidatus Latescibacterota bacterium]
MKKIILVRHATAVAKDPDKDDFNRSLRKKGRKEARAMAEWYRRVAELPDLFVSSPANRAIETALLFAKEFGYPKKRIVLEEAIYGGFEPSELLSFMKTLDDDYHSVMVFGHDPLFSEFAQFIAKGFEDYLPKCSIFGVTTNRRNWSTIKRGDGRLEIFEYPAGLHQRLDLVKAVRNEMMDRIEKGILTVLEEFGIAGNDDDRMKIRRTGAKLAKSFAARAALDNRGPDAKRPTKKVQSTEKTK